MKNSFAGTTKANNQFFLKVFSADCSKQKLLDEQICKFANLVSKISKKDVSKTFQESNYFSFISFLIKHVYSFIKVNFHNKDSFNENDIKALKALNETLTIFINWDNPSEELDEEIKTWYQNILNLKYDASYESDKIMRGVWNSEIVDAFNKLQNNTQSITSNYEGNSNTPNPTSTVASTDRLQSQVKEFAINPLIRLRRDQIEEMNSLVVDSPSTTTTSGSLGNPKGK
jgi:hypothetical protein